MSTEIICRGGFCPGFSVTSRLNPYNSVLYSLDIIPNPAAGSQAFEHTFFDFFEIFRQIGHIFPLCGIESRFFVRFAAFLCSFSVSLRPPFRPSSSVLRLRLFPPFAFSHFPLRLLFVAQGRFLPSAASPLSRLSRFLLLLCLLLSLTPLAYLAPAKMRARAFLSDFFLLPS